MRSPDAATLCRYRIVLTNARDQTPQQIAAGLGCRDPWVRDVMHAFTLHRGPHARSKLTSVWMLTLLAEVAPEEGLTREQVSHETIANLLAWLDIHLQRAKEWIASPDPAYTQKHSAATD